MTSRTREFFGYVAAFSAVAIALMTMRELALGDLSTFDLGLHCVVIFATIIAFTESRTRIDNA